MPLINCEINLILTWSSNCVIVSTDVADQGTTFSITDKKHYIPVVTFSTGINFFNKLFLTGININQKYQLKYRTNI